MNLAKPETAVTATNVYHSRRICTWTAGLIAANQIRFDAKPADATGAGVTLACSFILLGKQPFANSVNFETCKN